MALDLLVYFCLHLIAWCAIGATPPLFAWYSRRHWHIPLRHFFVGIALLGLELALLTYGLRSYQAQMESLDLITGQSSGDFALPIILHLASENLCLGVPIFVVSAMIVYLRRGGADKSPESNG